MLAWWFTYRAENRINSVAKCNVFGVACTAALVTSNPKQGDHR